MESEDDRMDWLNEKFKDKKNLPIIVGIAVFFLLAMGGLIAFEAGLFPSEASTASVAPPPVRTGGPPVPGNTPGGVPQDPRGSSLPPGPGGSNPFGAGGPAMAGTALAGVPGLNEARPGSTAPNPSGPNPYSIPNGRKLLAQRNGPVVGALALRDRLPRVDLYRLPPPTPVLVGINPYGSGQNTQLLAANYRLSGIVNGPDGNINGILEVGGQSQTVKPGDTLPDGSTVESITNTGLILRTPGGTPITITQSSGSDTPPGYPGQGFPGQGFPGQGYPGQGFPGQGYPGQGYPGQGFPGQGGQGFPGQGGPGFPNPGDNGGGGDFGDNG